MRNRIVVAVVACGLAVTGCATSVPGTATNSAAGNGASSSAGSTPGAADDFTPSEDNKDPSEKIAGIVRVDFPREGNTHVVAPRRVAYTHSPPLGGAHDQAWASCDGMVYKTAVRNENMIHMLEHGAIWIAYNPDTVTGSELDKLETKVSGQNFMALSPYPGLDKPISLQSWGHQLKLDSADDPRIDQFVKALKRNQYQSPEPNANCNALGPGLFDPDNPPPFDPSPPPADAAPESSR